MSNLAYYAADTFGMTLYAVNNGLESSEIRPVRMGPWQVDLQTDVLSDIINVKEVTFWVTMAKKLKLYVIVREKESWLIVLDNDILRGLTLTTNTGEMTVVERRRELLPAIKEVFLWTGGDWVKQVMEKP